LDRLERSLPPSPDEDTNIESNVEFLRSMEDSDPKKKDKGSKNHLKRGSLSSLGAGTKSILAGKFGDAFKRFEANSSGPPRTPSPLKDMDRHDLTPIAGSEAVDGRSDDGQPREWEDMTPEMRREQEARMLAQEEARVAAAQAEYKQRVGQRSGGPPVPPPKSIGGVSRVASIQNKVQSLIDESTRASVSVTRTAQGYGHYTDAAHASSAPKSAGGGDGRPVVPRKPVGTGSSSQVTGGQQQQQQRPPTSSGSSMEPSATGRTTASTSTAAGGPGRPMAPPKPTHLNKPLPAAGGRAPSPTKQIPLMPNSSQARGVSSPKIRGGGGPSSSIAGGGSGVGTEALLAVDLPGGGGSALLSMTAAEKDDYIRDFQKRFPSLGAIEMVERDLSAESGGGRSGR
jgi:AP2-associated kinase